MLSMELNTKPSQSLRTMKTISKALKYLAAIACAGFMASNASAIFIDPTSGALNTTRWEGNDNDQNTINPIIASIVGNSVEQYKVEPGESGPLAGSYDGSFTANGGLIDQTGPGVISPDAYLLVKDGNHEPAWYLFNMTALGWDGTDDIILLGFWSGTQGSISHLTLYSGSGTTVPDGGSMLVLLGGAVAVLGFLRRKIFA
jgi:hypothetical protein